MLTTVINKMRELGSLYEWSDDQEPIEFATRVDKVIAYYTAGFRGSRKEGSNANMMEYDEHLQLLEKLKLVLTLMALTPSEEGSLTLMDDYGMEVNLMPMLDFLEKKDVEVICCELNAIMERIVEYGTLKTLDEMKASYDTCDKLRIYFTILKRCD